jgi:hypothetical protein
MRCKRCGGYDLEYDESTDMYYCVDCRKLYEEKDIDAEKKDGLVLEPLDDEDLGGVPMVVLHILMAIPLLNIFALIIIAHTKIKVTYKRYFSYRFITQLIIAVALIIGLFTLLLNVRVDYENLVYTNTYNLVNTITFGDKISELQSCIPDVTTPTLDELLAESQVRKSKVFDSDSLNLVDGAIMTGKQVTKFIDKTSDYKLAYLIQTKAIVSRHGSQTCKNIGYVLRGAVPDENKSDAYYIEEKKTYAYYKNDKGELVYASTDDIKSDKYIFYINPDNYYKLSILYAKDDSIVGFKFKEVDF